MAGPGNAKAGRLSIGDLDLDTAWDSLAGEVGVPSAHEPPPETPPQPEPPFSRFGEGQSDAEAQLFAYLDRVKTPKASGFPPLDALSARLSEFTPVDGAQLNGHASERSDLAWFEEKFGELKRLLGRREEDKREIGAINAKLAEIINRVDRLALAVPGEATMAAVESQLAAVSHSLALTRQQSAADADRISRAAQEILEASGSAQEAREGFENAARHTVRELGQTVVVAASRAAAVTAEQIATALQRTNGQAAPSVVESELRALNAQSRESSEKTAAALERVHETLRHFLERGQPYQPSVSPGLTPVKKRAGIHMPIAADASAYAKSDSTFGGSPARKPQLDTITLRTPPPPDPNLLKALEAAEEKLKHGKRAGHHKTRSGYESPPAFLSSPLLHEDEKGLPIIGLGIVAFVLLLASAALYYLHTRTNLVPFHLTSMNRSEVVTTGPVSLPLPDRNGKGDLAPRSAIASLPQKDTPVLLAAAEQRNTPLVPPADAAEDVQLLTTAASRGDPEAQFKIGSRFLSDGSVQSDTAAAARWLTRAAEQGHTESKFILASLYERGAGVPKDETKALSLYREAANAGHIRAMHNLGVLLTTHDAPEDYREAAGWFIKAASAGLMDSQYNLALLYEHGLGVTADRQRAYFWYQVAAQTGDKEAKQNAERLKRLLPPAETETVLERAGSWHPTVEDVSRRSSQNARG